MIILCEDQYMLFNLSYTKENTEENIGVFAGEHTKWIYILVILLNDIG